MRSAAKLFFNILKRRVPVPDYPKEAFAAICSNTATALQGKLKAAYPCTYPKGFVSVAIPVSEAFLLKDEARCPQHIQTGP